MIECQGKTRREREGACVSIVRRRVVGNGFEFVMMMMMMVQYNGCYGLQCTDMLCILFSPLLLANGFMGQSK